MTDRLTQLITQRLTIEQQLYQLKNSTVTESKLDACQQLIAKLENTLSVVNGMLESIDIAPHSAVEMPEAHGHIDPATYNQMPDHEVQMARSELYRTAKHAIMLHKILQNLPEENGLEGWVQAKITKAADYIESVWHYLSYEMRFPYDENVEEAVAAYGPGEDPQAAATASAQKSTGTSQQQQQPGQASPVPPAGGSTPVATTPGMVKMAKLDSTKKPMGTPIMVKSAEIASKQKQGLFVIGESKIAKIKNEAASAKKIDMKGKKCTACKKGTYEETSLHDDLDGVLHCTKCNKKIDRHTISESSDTKKFKIRVKSSDGSNEIVIITATTEQEALRKALRSAEKDGFEDPVCQVIRENASAGASSAGGIAGNATGFASGGIGMQKRKDQDIGEDKPKQMLKAYKQPRSEVKPWFNDDESKTFRQKPVDPKKMDAVGRKIADVKKKAEEKGSDEEGYAGYKNEKKLDRRKDGVEKAIDKMTKEGTMSDAEKAQAGPEFTGYWKGNDKGKPGKKMVGGN